MTNVLIRDLPEKTHRSLQRRAEAQGQSLQQYLAAELDRLAALPSLDEVLRRIESRNGGRIGFEEAADSIAEERSGR